MVITAHATPRLRVADAAVRVVGAGLLLATGWIHLHLYLDGYRTIHLIGPSFLANGILALLAAVMLFLSPARLLGYAAVLGGLLELGTLSALGLSLTVGLFGFTETTRAPFVATAMLRAAGP